MDNNIVAWTQCVDWIECNELNRFTEYELYVALSDIGFLVNVLHLRHNYVLKTLK